MFDKPISKGRRRAIKLALGSAVALPLAESSLFRHVAHGALPVTTLFGSSVSIKAGVDTYWSHAFRRTSRMFGVEALPVVRFFSKDLPSWTGGDFKSIPDTTHIICSLRYPNFNRTVFVDWLKKMKTDAPGRKGKVTVIYEPEPENEILLDKKYTHEHLKSVQRQMRDSIDYNAKGWIFNASCLMGWTLDPRSDRNWRDYVNLPALDLLTWDPYNHKLTSDGHIRLDTGEKMFGPCANASASVNKPWAIAEFGTPIKPRHVYTYPITEIETWLHRLAKFALNPGQGRTPAKYVCYWNDSLDDGSKNYLVDDYPVLQKAWGCWVQGRTNCMA